MRRLVATINMTLDGYCDHTAVDGGEEIHIHFAETLRNAGVLLYGRVTYLLMEGFWPTVAKNPTGTKSFDDFAVAIDSVPKVVFSRTLKSVNWSTARLATKGLVEEIADLRKQPGKDIMVGSPGLITSLTKLDLFDEYQLTVHPVIVGRGLPLFRDITERMVLKLVKTKTFANGAMTHYYQPAKK